MGWHPCRADLLGSCGLICLYFGMSLRQQSIACNPVWCCKDCRQHQYSPKRGPFTQQWLWGVSGLRPQAAHWSATSTVQLQHPLLVRHPFSSSLAYSRWPCILVNSGHRIVVGEFSYGTSAKARVLVMCPLGTSPI